MFRRQGPRTSPSAGQGRPESPERPRVDSGIIAVSHHSEPDTWRSKRNGIEAVRIGGRERGRRRTLAGFTPHLPRLPGVG